MPGCKIVMSMKIIVIDESKKGPVTKCPIPKCMGRVDEIPNKRIFSCQTCHVAYSLIPGELEKELTIDGLQHKSEMLGMIPYKRSASGPMILGMDSQITSFKRIHLVTPELRDNAIGVPRSTAEDSSGRSVRRKGRRPHLRLAIHKNQRSPVHPVGGNAHNWICCNCGSGWLNVHTDLSCPICQIQRCMGCTYG
jgi:hypothetical protein